MTQEAAIIRMHLRTLEGTSGRLHIQHVSLAESAVLIAEAKRRGLAVTAEVTPHHLLLCADDIPSRDGEPDANWKMNPPLRSREDMLAMRRALAEGVVDMLATDHAPHTPAEKARGWADAPFGIIGLETALGACLSLMHDGTLTWARLQDALCAQPGRLVPLAPKDGVTLIDPDAEWVVEPSEFYSRGRNCPFAGTKFRGRPLYTFARGRLVMAEGEVLF
jgi:dihydroorotase